MFLSLVAYHYVDSRRLVRHGRPRRHDLTHYGDNSATARPVHNYWLLCCKGGQQGKNLHGDSRRSINSQVIEELARLLLKSR